jgi:AcrR family transcriptional regulator
MTGAPATPPVPSARQAELLDLAYRYALEHGRAELSLRPLAKAIGSSPRVLLYLFGSKDGLIRALLARFRVDELRLLRQAGLAEQAQSDDRSQPGDQAQPGGLAQPDSLAAVAGRIWSWLAAAAHRSLLTLWVDAYARSLAEPDGPWAGFAAATVADWLALLAAAQPPARRGTAAGAAERTLVLAVLRGALLDLLATGDAERATAAVRLHLGTLPGPGPSGPGPSGAG